MITNFIIQILAKCVVKGDAAKKISFNIVHNEYYLYRIGEYRLKEYPSRLVYMTKFLDVNGLDDLDKDSLIFYAEDLETNEILGTIRFTKNNFELEKLIGFEAISKITNCKTFADCLEISRLLISKRNSVQRLMPGLVVYSGLYIFFKTEYKKYIAYCKNENLSRFNGFRILNTGAVFKIEERGNHEYKLFYGSFSTDVIYFLFDLMKQSKKYLKLSINHT